MTTTRTIVVADDHPLFRKGLVEVLRGDGSWSIVAEVGDGTSALAAIERHRPAAAILDIDMPGLTGIEVATRVTAAGISTAVVVLTMHKSRVMFDGAMAAGVRGYVLKEHASSGILACLNLVVEGGTYVSPGISAGPESESGTRPAGGSAARLIALLTPSEREVLRHIAAERTSREIADALGISPKTVEHHRSNICAKLAIQKRNALMRFAAEHKAFLA